MPDWLSEGLGRVLQVFGCLGLLLIVTLVYLAATWWRDK